MEHVKSKNLKHFNTFGIDVQSDSFYEVSSQGDLKTLIDKGVFFAHYLILGGGSNILFTQNFKGSVIKVATKGIDVIKETDEHIYVEVQAGENWHNFVLYAVKNGWGGIENLSLIPGLCGAAPIQNIGAYGVEIKDVLEEVNCTHLKSGNKQTYKNVECGFGYRTSIFKTELKGEILINSITLKLSKSGFHTLKMSYGDIRSELEGINPDDITIKDISDAVIEIRRRKLPDPAELGNSGSFFKNPIIPAKVAKGLMCNFPEIKLYELADGSFKAAAGWLIEQSGWKGKKVGNCGSHAKQALVLVNYGNASGIEIKKLSEDIILSVFKKFGIQLEPEVNII